MNGRTDLPRPPIALGTAVRRARAGLLALLLASVPAAAEILEAGDAGFRIRLAVSVAGDPAGAFHLFTGAIDRWWNGAHTFSGLAAHLSLDAECFCERWDGKVVRHLAVAQFMPPEQLRLLGGLGPLQGLPVTGVLEIRFGARPPGAGTEGEMAAGTEVALTYAVRGAGLEGWAGPVEAVLAEQLERFRAHAAALAGQAGAAAIERGAGTTPGGSG